MKRFPVPQVRLPGLVLAAVLALVSPARSGPIAPLPPQSFVTGPATEEDYTIDFWRTGQGLPHNTVNALLQTRDGYLWTGTAAGLARFDGLTFTVLGDETALGLKDAPVTALLEDREGALWVGTQDRGLFRLRHGDAARFSTAQGLADNSVTSLAEDAAGDIWVGTQAGLNCWRRHQLESFASPAVRPGEPIVALHAGRSGLLWLTTRSGLFQLKGDQVRPFVSDQLPQGRNAEFIGAYEDRAGNLWAFGATFLLNLMQGQRLNTYFKSPELASSRVWTICEQNNGTFWIGTSGRGLFRFFNGRFESIGTRLGLDQCDLRALFADPQGNLWLGTSGRGLGRLRTRHSDFISVEQGLLASSISAVAADQTGTLWVGTADAGLFRWDGRRVEPFKGGAPLDRLTQIQTLCVDGQGTLWVGTWGAGLWQLTPAGYQRRFTTADGLSEDIILALACAPEGHDVWAATRAGMLHRFRAGALKTFTTANGLNGSPVLCLLAQRNGFLLAGTESGGIVRWDGKRFAPLPGPPELGAKPVRCLFQDRAGRLWAGTGGNGAFCRRDDQWVNLTTLKGLGSDNIGQIVQDDSGVFWFSAEENVFKVRAAELEEFFSGTRDLVASAPVMAGQGAEELRGAGGGPGFARDTNGVFWLAASTGLVPLSSRGRAPAEPPPPVLVERVLVNGQPLPFERGQPLRLEPGTHSLDIAFTAICFNAPQKVRFRHRLENYESDWVQSGDPRSAHYGPLPPGQYQFHVIAANADGVWNERGATLALVVVPPLWRSWWFLTLNTTAALALFLGGARFVSERRLRAKLRAAEQRHAMERERARIAQDMHDEIGSKLTRISFLSEVARNAGQNVPEVASPVEAIATSSRELLQSLDEIVWAVNPRNDNLEHLVGYLEQHAREYFQGTAVESEIHVPPQLPRVALSAEIRHNVFLAFEEALNNSLKHARPTHIRVEMLLAARAFEIQVHDNGQGFAAGAGSRPEQDGLENMRKRLHAVGGTCEVASQPGQGTTVRLRFPLPERETTPSNSEL